MNLTNNYIKNLSVFESKSIIPDSRYLSTSKPKNSTKKSLTEQPAVKNEVNSIKVFNAVDNFFNLGSSNRLEGYFNLSEEEKEKFAQMLAKLIKSGVHGYEILEVDGRREKHYIDLQLGDVRLYGAELYDEYGRYSYLA